MFKEAKANIAAAIILAVLVLSSLLGFIFLYEVPETYTASIINSNQTGFEFVPVEGYDANKIEEGEEFKFLITLDEAYSNSDITVKVIGFSVTKNESFDLLF